MQPATHCFMIGNAECHPAFTEASLVAIGSLLGIRETRRIMGDYVLRFDDYLARCGFPGKVCRSAYGLTCMAPGATDVCEQ